MREGTVFLIDDDAAVRKALRRLICACGYHVEALEDGSAYVVHAAPARPACLVLDVRMPHMGGLELRQRIVGTSRDVPIIFMTGHGAAEIRAQAMGPGVVDVLEKPVDQATLLAAIDKALALSVELG